MEQKHPIKNYKFNDLRKREVFFEIFKDIMPKSIGFSIKLLSTVISSNHGLVRDYAHQIFNEAVIDVMLKYGDNEIPDYFEFLFLRHIRYKSINWRKKIKKRMDRNILMIEGAFKGVTDKLLCEEIEQSMNESHGSSNTKIKKINNEISKLTNDQHRFVMEKYIELFLMGYSDPRIYDTILPEYCSRFNKMLSESNFRKIKERVIKKLKARFGGRRGYSPDKIQ